MAEGSRPLFESNGLLDFFLTPPLSTEDDDILPPPLSRPAFLESGLQRPSRIEYDDGSPPPDFDEEPSDFEDEVMGIMEREKESTSRAMHSAMDLDEVEDVPVASCERRSNRI
jgi:hypothetical protein